LPPIGNAILTNPAFIGNVADVYTATIGYDYKVARDSNTRLTYRFTHRQTETNSANSNAVMLAVKHDYDDPARRSLAARRSKKPDRASATR